MRMRERSWRLLLGALCGCAFVLLLCGGAGRLVACDRAERAVSPPRTVVAFLTEAHAQPQSMEREKARPMGGERLTRPISGLSPARVRETLLQRSDANGRVLRGRSYLREVYEAFALGDGFA